MLKHGPLTSGLLTITPDHYLSGDQFGSGFGYAVEILDLNNDG